LGDVGWMGIIAAGWPVLLVLLVGSVVSFAVIYDRWKVFKKIQLGSASFLDSLRKVSDTQKILAWCEKSDQPLAEITKGIFSAFPNREEKERSLGRSIQRLVQDLETHVFVLGTIASVAPFVGLLGTVIGIIKAFRAVSMSSTAGAGMVAIGISEALVGTAGGLVVAIPALLGYNYFVNKLRRLTQDWELAGADIIDMSLSKKG